MLVVSTAGLMLFNSAAFLVFFSDHHCFVFLAAAPLSVGTFHRRISSTVFT